MKKVEPRTLTEDFTLRSEPVGGLFLELQTHRGKQGGSIDLVLHILQRVSGHRVCGRVCAIHGDEESQRVQAVAAMNAGTVAEGHNRSSRRVLKLLSDWRNVRSETLLMGGFP